MKKIFQKIILFIVKMISKIKNLIEFLTIEKISP